MTEFQNVFQELDELIVRLYIIVNDETYKIKFYICYDYKVAS